MESGGVSRRGRAVRSNGVMADILVILFERETGKKYHGNPRYHWLDVAWDLRKKRLWQEPYDNRVHGICVKMGKMNLLSFSTYEYSWKVCIYGDVELTDEGREKAKSLCVMREMVGV